MRFKSKNDAASLRPGKELAGQDTGQPGAVYQFHPMQTRTVTTLASALLSGLLATAASADNITAIWANDGGDKVTQDELRATTKPTRVSNRAWDGMRIPLF